MKTIKLVAMCMLFAATNLANAQNFEWVKQINDGNGDKMTVDQSGNIYVFGETYDYTGFVEKYDATGNILWFKETENQFESIAVDDNGTVYLTGDFSYTDDFDPGEGIFNLTANGAQDIFILKLDASGNFVWAEQFGGNSDVAIDSYYEEGRSLTLDKNNNIYLLGQFADTCDFNPAENEDYNLISKGNSDIFILKLTNSGEFVWAKQFEGSNTNYGESDIGEEICVDDSANVYTVGEFNKTADFDPGAGVYDLTVSHSSIFISKLNESGDFVWAKKINSDYSDKVYSLTADKSGNIYIGALLNYAHITFLSGANTEDHSLRHNNILKLDASGNFIWAKQIGNNFTSSGSIAIDDSVNIYTTGSFLSVLSNPDFDPGPDEYRLVSTDDESDAYILKLDKSGNFIWVEQIKSYSSRGYDICVDGDNNIYTCGYFDGVTDFDPGNAIYNLEGNEDSYILKLSQSTTTVIQEQSFNSAISVYPNPTSGNINIELYKSYPQIIASVKNMVGQEILRKRFNSTDHFKLSLDGASKGMYFVNLTSSNNQRSVIKVIKQ